MRTVPSQHEPRVEDPLTLIRMVGSPFVEKGTHAFEIGEMDADRLYGVAFENRVELLYLRALEENGLLAGFEGHKAQMEERCTLTRRIAAEASATLTTAAVPHVVFKSIKPYPATPNDTDILCLGDETAYQRGLQALSNAGYGTIGIAPMQSLLYHPDGEGKVDSKKKGGTYYVDFYRGVAVDYYEYVSRESVAPYVEVRDVDGRQVHLLAAEPELAIVMFHNVFPEKTFQLEHFYLCLYGLANPEFDLGRLVEFVESNAMIAAVRCNLTIVEALHDRAFGSVPAPLRGLLDRWGREESVAASLRRARYRVTFVFSARVFWWVFASKLADPFSRRSLRRQLLHMTNPAFFWDAASSAWRRTFGRNIYEHK